MAAVVFVLADYPPQAHTATRSSCTAALAAFVVAAGGIAFQATWWRGLAVGAAFGSIMLIVAMWDGMPSSPAASALAFDVVIIVALVLARWPSADLVGG